MGATTVPLVVTMLRPLPAGCNARRALSSWLSQRGAQRNCEDYFHGITPLCEYQMKTRMATSAQNARRLWLPRRTRAAVICSC